MAQAAGAPAMDAGQLPPARQIASQRDQVEQVWLQFLLQFLLHFSLGQFGLVHCIYAHCSYACSPTDTASNAAPRRCAS